MPERPRAWLTTTARNHAVDRIRRDRVGAAKLRAVGAAQPRRRRRRGRPGRAGERDPGRPAAADLHLLPSRARVRGAGDARAADAVRPQHGGDRPRVPGRPSRPWPSGWSAPGRRSPPPASRTGCRRRTCSPSAPRPCSASSTCCSTRGTRRRPARALVRADLCAQAVRLAALVAELMPEDAEAGGLHALLLLQHARAAARVDADGVLVPLEEQDRSRWDRAMIDAGVAAVRRAVRRERVGPVPAPGADRRLPCHRRRRRPTPTGRGSSRSTTGSSRSFPSWTVRLNRAVAVAMSDRTARRARPARRPAGRRRPRPRPAAARHPRRPAAPAGADGPGQGGVRACAGRRRERGGAGVPGAPARRGRALRSRDDRAGVSGPGAGPGDAAG